MSATKSLIPVMLAKCATCPFGKNGDQRVKIRVINRLHKNSQFCHHPRLSGSKETHLCRGARDEQLTLMHRLGVLEQPTDQAWDEARIRLENSR